MKLILCVILVSLRFLNGSSLHSDVNTKWRIPEILYSNGLPYVTSRVFHDVGYTKNNVPFWINQATSFQVPCAQHLTDAIIKDFQVSIFKFITLVFRKAVTLAGGHFVFSPHTAWLSLAALAEGSEGPTRQELFRVLNLPEDRCLRQIFYRLATTRENIINDVILARNRLFVTDSSVRVNKNWERFARSYTQLNTVSIPFKSNPFGEIEGLKRIFKAQLPNINLNGNSFLLESLDYRGLWSSAFSGAVIETEPFYNTLGEQIGTMEYMKTLKRVNISYAASANIKVIELPVGRDERYKMLLAMTQGREDHATSLSGIQDSLVFETLANMRPTLAPIEIVIPRLTMTSEVEMRRVLEDAGIENLWTDPLVTR